MYIYILKQSWCTKGAIFLQFQYAPNTSCEKFVRVGSSFQFNFLPTYCTCKSFVNCNVMVKFKARETWQAFIGHEQNEFWSLIFLLLTAYFLLISLVVFFTFLQSNNNLLESWFLRNFAKFRYSIRYENLTTIKWKMYRIINQIVTQNNSYVDPFFHCLHVIQPRILRYQNGNWNAYQIYRRRKRDLFIRETKLMLMGR